MNDYENILTNFSNNYQYAIGYISQDIVNEILDNSLAEHKLKYVAHNILTSTEPIPDGANHPDGCTSQRTMLINNLIQVVVTRLCMSLPNFSAVFNKLMDYPNSLASDLKKQAFLPALLSFLGLLYSGQVTNISKSDIESQLKQITLFTKQVDDNSLKYFTSTIQKFSIRADPTIISEINTFLHIESNIPTFRAKQFSNFEQLSIPDMIRSDKNEEYYPPDPITLTSKLGLLVQSDAPKCQSKRHLTIADTIHQIAASRHHGKCFYCMEEDDNEDDDDDDETEPDEDVTCGSYPDGYDPLKDNNCVIWSPLSPIPLHILRIYQVLKLDLDEENRFHQIECICQSLAVLLYPGIPVEKIKNQALTFAYFCMCEAKKLAFNIDECCDNVTYCQLMDSFFTYISRIVFNSFYSRVKMVHPFSTGLCLRSFLFDDKARRECPVLYSYLRMCKHFSRIKLIPPIAKGYADIVNEITKGESTDTIIGQNFNEIYRKATAIYYNQPYGKCEETQDYSYYDLIPYDKTIKDWTFAQVLTNLSYAHNEFISTLRNNCIAVNCRSIDDYKIDNIENIMIDTQSINGLISMLAHGNMDEEGIPHFTHFDEDQFICILKERYSFTLILHTCLMGNDRLVNTAPFLVDAFQEKHGSKRLFEDQRKAIISLLTKQKGPGLTAFCEYVMSSLIGEKIFEMNLIKHGEKINISIIADAVSALIAAREKCNNDFEVLQAPDIYRLIRTFNGVGKYRSFVFEFCGDDGGTAMEVKRNLQKTRDFLIQYITKESTIPKGTFEQKCMHIFPGSTSIFSYTDEQGQIINEIFNPSLSHDVFKEEREIVKQLIDHGAQIEDLIKTLKSIEELLQ